jgi:HSP20 family molecular chaperone IbpA
MQDVDEAVADAKYSDGVLTLYLPKQTVSKTKSLTIK